MVDQYREGKTEVLAKHSENASLLTYLLHGAEFFLRSQLVMQLVKKFPALYGTRKFIIVFTSACHLSLS